LYKPGYHSARALSRFTGKYKLEITAGTVQTIRALKRS